jgi:CBS domain-containing protein
MATTVKDVMTRNPITLEASATALDAARAMRDADVGNVIVCEGGRVAGIVTDRDIVVRDVAEGKDPASTRLAEIASRNVATLSPDDPIEAAVQIMRDNAVRRVPVVDGDTPVGVISIGDLAVERDPQSALADISSSPPNS